MKTLLVAINAKYIHTNPAIYDLWAYCGRYREEIFLAEYTINHYTEDILMDIYKKKPEFIGFSCYIWNIEIVKELGKELRKLLPDVPIWLGGPEVSYDSEIFLKEEKWATGIMCGEGEVTFAELMDYYQVTTDKLTHRESAKTSLQAIKGIVYRVTGDGRRSNTTELCDSNGLCPVQINPLREVTDLSTIPFIYEDMSLFEHKIVYYESSRGCPFSCSYCLSSIDKTVRFRDIELVKYELKFFLEHKVPQVKFVDRTFNCNKNHAMAIWKYIKEHDNGITNFHFEIAADLLGDEEIHLLASMRPGLVQLEIGVQTTNPNTLEEIKRRMDLDNLEKIVSRIRAGGNVHQHLDLIAGLPFEDYESFKQSFDRVYAMKPDQLQLGFLKVLKGSYMHAKASDYGIGYKEKAPYEVLYTNWITFDEMIQLKSVEKMVEMYYNSDQFEHTLEYFVPRFDSAFLFYKELADFYEQKELQMMSHARITRYEILLEFLSNYLQGQHLEQLESTSVDECTDVEMELQKARELLILDLYARENMKTRPVWAKDLTPYKERIQGFYRREAHERTFLKEYDGYNARQLGNMTHIEIFTCIHKEETAVLFDYAVRNPKNKEAQMYLVDLPAK